MTALDIVIPTFRGSARLMRSLPTLLAQLRVGDRVIVVDDASGDASVEQLRAAFPEATIIGRAANGGFASTANQGIRAGDGPWVAVLNDDCTVAPEWRDAVLDSQRRWPDAGAIASRVVNDSNPGILDSAGFELSGEGVVQRLRGQPSDVASTAGWVLGPAGSAAVFRRSVLDAVGLFDESLGSFFEDVDLALRLQRAGHRCRYQPGAVVRHEGGASFARHSPRHVRLVVRNNLFVIGRDLPLPLLVRLLPAYAWHQLRAAASLTLRHRQPGAWAAGVAGFLQLLPALVAGRRQQRALRDWRAFGRNCRFIEDTR